MYVFAPTAVLLIPVVLVDMELSPIAMLLYPDVFEYNALFPIPILFILDAL